MKKLLIVIAGLFPFSLAVASPPSTPLLRFSLSPGMPVQGSEINLFVTPTTTYNGETILLDAVLDSNTNLTLLQPSKNLWIFHSTGFNSLKSHNIQFTVSVEDTAQANSITKSITDTTNAIANIQKQIGKTTDPVKLADLRAQLATAQTALGTFQSQLAALKTTIGSETYNFSVNSAPPGGAFPRISSVSPDVGNAAGGGQVMITGTNFQLGATVFFGDVQSENVTVVNSTTILAGVPALSLGVKDVEVDFPVSPGASDPETAVLSNGYFVTNSSLGGGVAPTATAVISAASSASVGAALPLSASQSFGSNPGDALTYAWSLISAPDNSALPLNTVFATTVSPNFTPDKPGNYIVQLVVVDTATNAVGPAVVKVINAALPSAALSATASAINVQFDGLATSQISVNDSNSANLQFSYYISTAPTKGSAEVSPTGLISYKGISVGSDTIGVTVLDNIGESYSFTVPVTVTGTSLSATAPSISLLAGGQGTSQISVTDASSSTLQFFYYVSTPPSHGSASVSPAGVIAYQSQTVGSDAIGITVVNTLGESYSLVVPVSVNGTSLSATAPSISTLVGGQGTSQITVTDENSSSLQFFYHVSTPPSHGSASVSPTGLIFYQSQTVGSDSIGITVVDSVGESFSFSVSVTVATATLTASAPAISVQLGNQGTSQIAVNDSNSANLQFSYYISSSPTHGSAQISSTGLITYQSFSIGSDTIGVSVFDNAGGSFTFNVPVTVSGTSLSATAPPINLLTGGQGTSQISVLDVNSSFLQFFYYISAAPSHGAASVSSSGLITYQSQTVGSDSVGITVVDSAGESFSFTVPVTVNGTSLSASAPAISTLAGSQATSQISVTDEGTSSLQFFYYVSTAPNHGAASVSATGLITFRSYSVGSDSIGITVVNSAGEAYIFTVPVTVNTSELTATAPAIDVQVGSQATSQIAIDDANSANLLFSYYLTQTPTLGVANVSPTGLVSYQSFIAGSSDSIGITIYDSLGESYNIVVPVTIHQTQAANSIYCATTENGYPLHNDCGVHIGDPSLGTFAFATWNFGDGTTDVSYNPFLSHEYFAPGTYPVQAIVTFTNGNTATVNASVTAASLTVPAAKFVISSVSNSAPYTVTVDGSPLMASMPPNMNPFIDWQWGDGSDTVSPPSDPGGTHTYAASGTYTLNLNLGGFDDQTSSFYGQGASTEIYVGVAAPATGSPPISRPVVTSAREIVKGTPFQFDGSTYSFDPNQGGSISSYAWSFDDRTNCPTNGCTATGPSPSHIYSDAMNHWVSLAVTDTEGGTSSSVLEVVSVNSGHAPQAVIKASPPLFGVAPLTLNADASLSYDVDGTISSYSWDWGDGSAKDSTAVASHLYSDCGLYFLSLTVTDNDGNSHTTYQTVVVNVRAIETAIQTKPTNGPQKGFGYYVQGLTATCAQGQGESCHKLAAIYSKEGESATEKLLDERACTLGFSNACTAGKR